MAKMIPKVMTLHVMMRWVLLEQGWVMMVVVVAGGDVCRCDIFGA